MNIVEISTDVIETPPNLGGAIESYVYGLSRALSSKGNQVHIIGLQNKGINYDAENLIFHNIDKRTNLSRIHLPFGSKSIVDLSVSVKRVFLSLHSIIKEFGDIDFIHCHLLDTALSTVFIRYLYIKKINKFFHFHNLFTTTKTNWAFLSLLLKYNFEREFAVSNFVKNEMVKKFRFLSNELDIISNAIDPKEFTDIPNMGVLKFLPSDSTKILFVGRIVPEKGLHYILQAFSYLKKIKKLNNIILVIVGPMGGFIGNKRFAYKDYINKLIKELCIKKNVFFLGNVTRTNLISIYKESDFTIIPSNWGDPCPTVILESYACERPVIAFRDGGIPEIVDDEVTGFLINKGDIKGLGNKILAFKENSNMVKIMGQKSKKLLEKKFSYNVVAEKIMKIYENLYY